MRINTQFAIAVHILALIHLNQEQPAASEKMAASAGCHPVMVRHIMSALKKAGLLETRSGVPGGRLARAPEDISLLEIYRVVQRKDHASLFDLHPAPNPVCPVGRNIKGALEAPLGSAQTAMENELANWSLRDVTAYIIAQENPQTGN